LKKLPANFGVIAFLVPLSLPELKRKALKSKHVVAIVLLVILADQALKYYIKTTYVLGQETNIFGSWFRLHFTENSGMAWGWSLPTSFGKIALTLFRVVAVIFGTFLIGSFIREKRHTGLIICSALIYAGALGNLIDSLFYGLVFDASSPINVAQFMPKAGGYDSFMHGKVVDMLYFPLIEDKLMPAWVPFWGGKPFTFFSAIFNIADAAISVGVITLFIFQKRYLHKRESEKPHPTVETNTPVDDTVQIS
jgi:signal peptidase II